MTSFVRGRVAKVSDPATFAQELWAEYVGLTHCRVLGLDLGTNCGFAVADLDLTRKTAEIRVLAGQWDLSIGNYDSGALRHLRLRSFLEAVRPTLIGYEEPKVVVPQAQVAGRSVQAIVARVVPTAEFLGALKTTVMCWADARQIPCQGYGIGQIKKFLTTKGSASKEDMIRACNDRYGTDLVVEGYETSGADNVADAIGVCALAVEQYAGGLG